jgi:hypothetical protein
MKYYFYVPMLVLSLTGFSWAGDSANGFNNRPSGRVVVVTKTNAHEVVRVTRKVVSNCVNGKCNSRPVTRVR